MKTIVEQIKGEIQKMNERGWDRIYFLIDIHDTIFKACYRDHERCEWLGDSMGALQKLSNDRRFILILWSSTHPGILENYLQVFKENGIRFDYVNANPEVRTDDLGCFERKPYFNVLIDDKAGFTSADWTSILETEL